MSADHTLDSKAEEGGITTQHTAVSSSSSLTDREAFLSSFSAEEDKKIMRKVDKRFLLLIGLMYVLKNVDYINAATVKVLQVNQPRNVLIELNMTADQYNWVQSIYFIAYIVFEVPSNLLLKKMSPRNWQSRIIASWGLVLACHAAVRNKEGLYACRFFLGMMEAGLFPGLAAQLCSWYRSDEMGKPIMWMFGFQNCAGIIGSIVAYGISYMNGLGGLSAWQWVYLLEGLYTILFAGVVYLVLPDYPKSKRSAKWLTPREQEYIELRLTDNAPRTDDPAFNLSEVIASLKDPRTYSFCLAQILMNLGGYGLQWQLPTVTTNLGFAGLPRNQLLNIPPAAASVLAIIFAGWFLKRAYLTRPEFSMFICAGAFAFFLVLCVHVGRTATYIACIFGTMFYSVYFIPFWAWRSATLKGTTGAAFTLAFQSCIGQVGGVVGPQLFQSKYAHNGYKVSFAICAAAIGLSWLATCWTWYLTRKNENDIQRVRKLRIKAAKEGGVFAGEDVKL
ncbi:hypothetical protein HRR83_002260 [Exophiala dermatitidis]|uniref:MFS transporter, ACS family, allantoate permease n=2 Tax=Exophiala dermatitidis TaxID=5970 RepID=H6BY87_EXODN|nr:MFS transporter, ACS family, allantoate permease [Exophiala dermatitidis NIH/UT8656]KAJ4520281.1 hypothetical protein HRR75_002146 [Exophiala dermatitidis]EHY56655.1 MFS transporter, ACS family, allantoate permease [Exophiala dermatitidis NIH/UT8656]KAJ4524140.1 hypothetical protein HRR74_002337 [Exophiala dermatitidis]KAJ4525588.1 hypothetical protein HRR73_002318 [Exophiala dermatitidis]KAJ4536906.1 hypothetical protein HRR76_004931 [Exophiala dermatitidis]